MEIALFIFGAVVGSFLSVCIFRLPFHKSVGLVEELTCIASEEGKPLTEYIPPAIIDHQKDISINTPRRSLCPTCKHQLSWWHNIPIVSWIMLRGKCGFCGVRLSIRYPLVEITSGLLAVLSVHTFGLTVSALFAFITACTLLVISLIDYDWYIIPDIISLPGTVIALVISTANGYLKFLSTPFANSLTQGVIGILCGAGFLWLVSFLYLKIRKHDGLGLGDVKLLALVGALLGPAGALWTIFIGSVLGSIGGVLMMIIARRGMTHPLPFGPYLAIATTIFLFWSDNPLVERFLPTVLGN